MCSDQQHFRALGRLDPFFETPASDELAAASVAFESAFCTSPQCSPSRSSLLTGFYPHRTGVIRNVDAPGGVALAMRTIGGLLQAGGYDTGYFGKWHLGGDPAGNVGWSEERKDASDRETTERGIRFLADRAARGAPFALFLMYRDPHTVYRFEPGQDDVSALRVPLPPSWYRETFERKPRAQREFVLRDAGKRLWGRPPEAWQEFRVFYRERVRRFDAQLGRILAALREHGLWEDTIVVTTSDHGEMDTNHKLVFKGPFMYEHVTRIPMTIRVPGRHGGVGPRVADWLWVHTDLVPTLLDLAGLPPVECDGRSAGAVLTGRGGAPPRDYVVCEYHGKGGWTQPIRMIRTRDLKLVRYGGNGDELYDLREDPDELVNLAGDPRAAQRQRELERALEAWMAAHGDPFASLAAARARS